MTLPAYTAGARVRGIVASASVLLMPCAAWAGGQQSPVVFRSDARLVVVQAVVFAQDRQPVTNLTVDDFMITEQGNERSISVFLAPSEGPIEVAVVIDASSSMARWPTKEATAALLSSLHPGSCVLMVPFNDRVHIGAWGHPNDPAVRDAVSRLELNGETGIFDALLAAFQLMRERVAAAGTETGVDTPSFAGLMRFRIPGAWSGGGVPPPAGQCTVRDALSSRDELPVIRRAVVVVTDGQDNISQSTIEDVLLSAWGSGLPVFAFAATERGKSGSLEVRGRPARLGHVRALERLVQYTGGFVIRETMDRRTPQPFWDGFERLGAALRGHYVLGFIPDRGSDDSALADHRNIKVSVRRRGFDVLAPSDLELGRGASDGAALDLALRGFHEFAAGQPSRALSTFDTAATIGPRLGLVHYGRGAVLAVVGRWNEAVAALRLAKELAPWIPDLDARIAETLLELEEIERAWDSALLAYSAGSEIQPLLERLQQLAPRDIDFTRLARGRRVGLKVGPTTTAHGALAAAPILAALGVALADSQELSLGHVGQRMSVVLLVDIAKVRTRGGRTSAQGWLVLQNQVGDELETSAGEQLLNRRFSFEDIDSVAELRSEAIAVVQALESALTNR